MQFFFFHSSVQCNYEDHIVYLSLHSTGQSGLEVGTEDESWTPELLRAVLQKQVS
jgi:hypothetical protein